jgi:hypothetical protein
MLCHHGLVFLRRKPLHSFYCRHSSRSRVLRAIALSLYLLLLLLFLCLSQVTHYYLSGL